MATKKHAGKKAAVKKAPKKSAKKGSAGKSVNKKNGSKTNSATGAEKKKNHSSDELEEKKVTNTTDGASDPAEQNNASAPAAENSETHTPPAVSDENTNTETTSTAAENPTAEGEVKKDEGEKSAETPAAVAEPVSDLPPMDAAVATNLVVQYRAEVQKTAVDNKQEFYDQIYGAAGIMKDLNSYTNRIPVNQQSQYKEALGLLERDVEAKLGGYRPSGESGAQPTAFTQPTTQQHLTPPVEEKPAAENSTPEKQAPVKKTPEEQLNDKFDSVINFLKNWQKEKVVHLQHMEDFCKTNSADGFVFTYDKVTSKLKATYFGGRYTKEEVFELSK